LRTKVARFLASLLFVFPLAIAQIYANIEVNGQSYGGGINIGTSNLSIIPEGNLEFPSLPTSQLSLELEKLSATTPRLTISPPSLPTKEQALKLAWGNSFSKSVLDVNCNIPISVPISFSSIAVGITPLLNFYGPTYFLNPNDYIKLIFDKLQVSVNVNANIYGKTYRTSTQAEAENAEVYTGKVEEIINATRQGKPVKGKTIGINIGGISLPINFSIPVHYAINLGELPITFPITCPPGIVRTKLSVPIASIIGASSSNICNSLASFSENALNLGGSSSLNVSIKPNIYIPTYKIAGTRMATNIIHLGGTSFNVNINLNVGKFCLDYVTQGLPILILMIILSLFLSWLANKFNTAISYAEESRNEYTSFLDNLTQLANAANTNVTPLFKSDTNVCINISGITYNCPSGSVYDLGVAYSERTKHYVYQYEGTPLYFENKINEINALNLSVTEPDGCVINLALDKGGLVSQLESLNASAKYSEKVYPYEGYELFGVSLGIYGNETYYVYPIVMNAVTNARNVVTTAYAYQMVLPKIDQAYRGLLSPDNWTATTELFYTLLNGNSNAATAYSLFTNYLLNFYSVYINYLKEKINSIVPLLKESENETLREELEEYYNDYNTLLNVTNKLKQGDLTLYDIASSSGIIEKYWYNLTDKLEEVNCINGSAFIKQYYLSMVEVNNCFRAFSILYQIKQELEKGYATVANPQAFGMDSDQLLNKLEKIFSILSVSDIASICSLGNIDNALVNLETLVNTTKDKVNNLISDAENNGKLPSIYALIMLIIEVISILHIINNVLNLLTKEVFPCIECITNGLIAMAGGSLFGGSAVPGLLAVKDTFAMLTAVTEDIEKVSSKTIDFASNTLDVIYNSYNAMVKSANETTNCCINCWDKIPQEVLYYLEKRCVALAAQCNYRAIKCLISNTNAPEDLRKAVISTYGRNCLSYWLSVNNVNDFIYVARLVLDNSLSSIEKVYAIQQLKDYIENKMTTDAVSIIKQQLGNDLIALLKILYPFAVKDGKLLVYDLPPRARLLIS